MTTEFPFTFPGTFGDGGPGGPGPELAGASDVLDVRDSPLQFTRNVMGRMACLLP